MYHPAKVWRRGFAALMNDHLSGAVLRNVDSDVSYSFNPLDYAGLGVLEPLKGSRAFVTDQRASGMNAVLWRDPSMIL